MWVSSIIVSHRLLLQLPFQQRNSFDGTEMQPQAERVSETSLWNHFSVLHSYYNSMAMSSLQFLFFPTFSSSSSFSIRCAVVVVCVFSAMKRNKTKQKEEEEENSGNSSVEWGKICDFYSWEWQWATIKNYFSLRFVHETRRPIQRRSRHALLCGCATACITTV